MNDDCLIQENELGVNIHFVIRGLFFIFSCAKLIRNQKSEIRNQKSEIRNFIIMALTVRQKQNIKKEYGLHETDTGSAEIQIAFLTKQISELADHLKKNLKDNHSRRGLLKMVSKRKKLLVYLSANNNKSYTSLVRKLGLKK